MTNDKGKELGPRILVAGDEPLLRQRLLIALAKLELNCPAGHVVELEQVVDRVGRVAPDVVILTASDDQSLSRRTLQSLDKLIRGRVLVVGPANDPHSILELLQAGADTYLDRDKLEEDLPAALLRFRMKATAQENSTNQGRVLGVLGASGGSGASTIAANLATCLAREHGEVALVDLRLASADLSALLDLQPTYSLADFCERLDRMDPEMFERFLTRHSSGVQLIAAPLDASQADGVSARGVCRALAMARSRFPYVVVDLDNHLDEVQAEALWQVHQLIIVLRLDYISIRNTRRLLTHLESHGIEAAQIRLVVNRHRQPHEVPAKQAEEALGRKIERFVRNDPGRVNRAINQGSPLVLEFPWAGITRDLSKLATSVNGAPHPPLHTR
jgi:pilus assembly protein CpaE